MGGGYNLLAEVKPEHGLSVEGKQIQSLKDLRGAVEKIQKNSFSKYVNESKHSFHIWVKDIYKHRGLSSELEDCDTKESVVSCLNKWLEKAELEREIVQKVVKEKITELVKKAKDAEFNPASWADPLILGQKKKASSKFEHPKKVREVITAPKLWELKPVQRLDFKQKIMRKPAMIKQVKLTEVDEIGEKKEIQKGEVKEYPSRLALMSRKVNAMSASEVIEKMKEVYQFEI